MSSALTWSQSTEYNPTLGSYNTFGSKYNNVRYLLKPMQVYKVTTMDMANLPGISYKVYGTVDLWRFILEYNGLNDPLSDIYPGLVLNIPDKMSILSHLNNTSSSKDSDARVVRI